MTTYKTTAAAAADLTTEWGKADGTDSYGPAVRRLFPYLGRTLDALTAGTGTAHAAADAWGVLDDEPGTAESRLLTWIVEAWPALTDTLDGLLAAELFDPEGPKP